MAKETERKYLVVSDSFKSLAVKSVEIEQGYLGTDPDATVRVRVSDGRAWLTVKSRNVGATRGEWEYPVPADDAREMLRACCGGRMIAKTRYIVPSLAPDGTPDGLKWEVDVFHGRHEGLVVAEIELPSEDAVYALPPFIGREVTGEPQYYNSVLSGISPQG